MRGQDIMDLPGLQNDGEMSDIDIAEALGLKIRDCRSRLSSLVIHEMLVRIPGIASTPPRYRLKSKRQVPFQSRARA